VPVLFDTSVYIAALRAGEDALLSLRRVTTQAPIWLSAVVLEELYSGATPDGLRLLQRLERDFDRLKRILIPNLSDWVQAGQVLARLATRYGYEEIGRGRLTNDALLAISAGRQGITILTRNARDFRRLAEFRPFHWQIQAHV
jgi:predicted nucleic acid-binding protein